MKQPKEDEVPEGAAVFPFIPPDLGVDPLLLAVIHAVVFVNGSAPEIINQPAADEALDYMCGYLQRLDGKQLLRVREDIDVLVRYAREERWERALIEVLTSFLGACGVENGAEDDED